MFLLLVIASRVFSRASRAQEPQKDGDGVFGQVRG